MPSTEPCASRPGCHQMQADWASVGSGADMLKVFIATSLGWSHMARLKFCDHADRLSSRQKQAKRVSGSLKAQEQGVSAGPMDAK